MDSELSDARNGLTHGSSPVYSYILSGIALFILLIACINFVNLTVARSVKRSKEIGICKVAGSLRKQLMYRFLGESFLVAIVIALPLSYYAVNIGLQNFAYRVEISWTYFALSAMLAIAIVTVSFQSLKTAMMNPVRSLKSE